MLFSNDYLNEHYYDFLNFLFQEIFFDWVYFNLKMELIIKSIIFKDDSKDGNKKYVLFYKKIISGDEIRCLIVFSFYLKNRFF